MHDDARCREAALGCGNVIDAGLLPRRTGNPLRISLADPPAIQRNLACTVWSGHSCRVPLILFLPLILIWVPISRVLCEKWEFRLRDGRPVEHTIRSHPSFSRYAH